VSAGRASSARHWGWHQLAPDWADRLVAAAGVGPGDLVLDLGAGTGALTEPLRRRGARVLAVELHPGRAADLRRRYADVARRGPGSVAVVEQDLFLLRWPDRPFHVVANPPWAAAVTLLRLLTAPRSRLRSARLVLPAGLVQQAEHRRRGVGPGFWGRDRGVVPGSAFRPPPPGPAAVLELGRGRPGRGD
jgi:23S rRNA (adenine-N6)-dimethyltransferase